MGDAVYEDPRNEKSPTQKTRPSSVGCYKEGFGHNENTVPTCQKLIEDFRFLLRSEFFNLATTTFKTKCFGCSIPYNNSSNNFGFKDASPELNDSFTGPHVLNLGASQLRPGTMMKMLFSEIEQNMEKVSLQDRSQILRCYYSK